MDPSWNRIGRCTRFCTSFATNVYG
uniref:Uncharacterized protein n=1 Tax=Anguilla anguilla TaxID=7936 RepID=A0A0E9UZN2_ANGAN